MVACLQGSDAGQKCYKISRILNCGVQLWLTRIRSDLVTADRPIILEFTLNDSAVYLEAVCRFGRLMDPLQNRTFWPVNYQISTKLSPNFTATVDQLCMSMPSYLQGGQVREGRARTGSIQSISLTFACLQGSDSGQKCVKISRICNFGVQLWLTRTRSNLATADRPIILESTLTDSAVYLEAVCRSGRLMDPIQNRTFWPVNYQISTKLSPNFTDYCGSAVHVHAFILTGWTGKGR